MQFSVVNNTDGNVETGTPTATLNFCQIHKKPVDEGKLDNETLSFNDSISYRHWSKRQIV